MAKVSGRELGAVLCDALGLEKNVVRSLTLHCDTSSIASVLVEQYVTDEQGRKIGAVMVKEYDLIERETADADR